MTQENSKQVKFRAFNVPNKDPQKKSTEIVDKLKNALSEKKKIANDRRMLLSKIDDQKEEDLMSFYTVNNKDYVFGLMLRIFPSDITSNIPDAYLDHEQIKIGDLKGETGPVKIMFKDHYYFFLTDAILITNLPLNKSIKRFQTYINWLLGVDEVNEMFEFSPMIKKLDSPKLYDIENIVFQDSVIYNDSTIQNISTNLIEKWISGVENFEKIKLNLMVSAKLVVKFKKPPKMRKDEFDKTMSAQLKAVNDVNDVSILTKSGKIIKGSEIIRIKEVPIDLTENKKLSEMDLLTEMKRFFEEIKNENEN